MEAIRYVQHRGIGLYVEDVTLKAYPAFRLTPELRSFIRDHRDEMMAALGKDDLDITVGNILALQPHEVEELRQEIAGTPDDDPNIEHDRAALAKAEPIIQRRQEQVEGTAA